MTMGGQEREVVIIMTDMVQYSQKTSGMTPDEIKNFLIEYHETLYNLAHTGISTPPEIEPSAGDGCLIVFEKRSGEDNSTICTKALEIAIKLAEAVSDGRLVPTRMGVLLGEITEAKLGTRYAKFGSSFAIANRLEELCGHFGTHFLMDREVARLQTKYDEYLVNVAKVSLTSVLHPMNIFTLYMPGIQNCPKDIDKKDLATFIAVKNEAMDHFTGNQITGMQANFPKVRDKLLVAQKKFRQLTGKEDKGIERILEYIRETPYPAAGFNQRGIELMEKKRDSLGDRLFHMSKQLLRALNPEFYHALVVDTKWERYFHLEWCKKGDDIIEIDSVPDGIYYLDSGMAKTYNMKGELLSTIEAGNIFGEMAYFGKEKRRTATVRAESDVVLRKISTKDFEKLPVIVKIFEKIAQARRSEIVRDSNRPEDKAVDS